MRVSLALSLLLGLAALTSTQATEQRHRRDRVVVRPSFTAGFPSQGYRPGGPSPISNVPNSDDPSELGGQPPCGC